MVPFKMLVTQFARIILILGDKFTEKWQHKLVALMVKKTKQKPACQCRRHERLFQSQGQEDPLEDTPVEESIPCLDKDMHGQRSRAGYSPQGCQELDTTEAT